MNYLIRLKPLEPFFFGGDKTFGSSYGKEEANFYVRSEKMPQQTQLMGMIRKTILQQKRLLKWHPYKKDNSLRFSQWVAVKQDYARELVGMGKLTSQSLFDDERLNLGVIDRISPLFFTKEKLFYTFSPILDDMQYELQKDDNIKTSINGNILEHAYKIKDKKEGKEWLAKEGLYQKMIGVDQNGNIREIYSKNIFEEITDIGNQKNSANNHRFKRRDAEDKKEGFFKKVTYMLKDDFSFAFLLHTNKNIDLKKDIVQLGGENSKFLIFVEEVPVETDFTFLFRSVYEKEGFVTLGSDTFVPHDILDKNEVELVISNGIHSFRTLERREKSKKWQYNHKSTSTHSLLKQGTMIKIEKESMATFLSLLHKPNLEKIGYNITFPKELS